MTPTKKRARVALDIAAPSIEYVPPVEGADSVRIGDRVHYTHPVQGGPWHGVVIASIDGGCRVKVTKPSGADLVIDWTADGTTCGALDFI